jgi:hypothetical protein
MRCPVCNLEAESLPSGGDWVGIACRRCGRFRVSSSLMASSAERSSMEGNLRLSAFLRQQNEAGTEPPLLTTASLPSIVDDLPHHDPRTKLDLLLRLIHARTGTPGASVKLDTQLDAPLAWIESPLEFELLLGELEKRDLVEREHIPGTALRGSARVVRLTFLGLDKTPRTGQVFVAMPFHPSREADYTDGILPAIEDAGYRAYRVKDDPSGGKIDELILAEIRRSAFLVADASGQNVNVYFEAGFAEGLGRSVVWIVSRKQIESGPLPFDTQTVSHVVFETKDELRRELARVLVHRFGLGPRG